MLAGASAGDLVHAGRSAKRHRDPLGACLASGNQLEATATTLRGGHVAQKNYRAVAITDGKGDQSERYSVVFSVGEWRDTYDAAVADGPDVLATTEMAS